MEILLILALALLFFGPARLPGLGSSLGSAVRSFKRGLNGLDEGTPDNASRALPPDGQPKPPSA
jgi:sec-independent protein translocase protein TatA